MINVVLYSLWFHGNACMYNQPLHARVVYALRCVIHTPAWTVCPSTCHPQNIITPRSSQDDQGVKWAVTINVPLDSAPLSFA